MLQHRALRAILLALLIVAPACVDRQKIRPHTALGPAAEPLRAQFNRDVGQVRVVVIVAPT
jgi:hypothetical protein